MKNRKELEKEINDYNLNIIKSKIKINNEIKLYDDNNNKLFNKLRKKYDHDISKIDLKYEYEKKELEKDFIKKSIKDTINNVIDLTPLINYPIYYYYKNKLRKKYDPILQNGVHFINALQGGGKSSLAFNLAEHIYYNENKICFLNAKFEKPRYDDSKLKWIKHHYYFKLSDYFNAVPSEYDSKGNVKKYEIEQLKKFPKECNTIILDEWLTEMNHRQNKTSNYNDIFLALIAMIAHMRHQNIKRIYVLSQIDNTDIQLMSMFKFRHEVQVRLGNSYFNDFLRNHNLKNKILGWNVDSYKITRNRKKKSTEEILVKKRFIQATADFTYFDTYSMADKYKNLPEAKINFIDA